MKFSIVGIINTLITISCIFMLTKIAGFHYIVANIIGYTLGLTNSFFMNRFWTFKSSGKYGRESIRFLTVFALSYLSQLILLVLLKERLVIPADYAQIIAMIFYTAINFFTNKFFTFRTVAETWN